MEITTKYFCDECDKATDKTVLFNPAREGYSLCLNCLKKAVSLLENDVTLEVQSVTVGHKSFTI